MPLLEPDDVEYHDVPGTIVDRYLPVPPPLVYCSITYDTSTSSFPTTEETERLSEDFKLELVSHR